MNPKSAENTKIEDPSAQESTYDHSRLQRLAGKLVRNRKETRQKKRRKRFITTLIIFLVLASGGLLWYVLRPIPVDITYVNYQRVGAASQPILRLSGYITYPRISTIGSTLMRPVKEINFKEGDHVKAGDILVRFDNSILLDQENIQQIATNDLQETYNRTVRLHSSGAASIADLQNARMNLEAAQAKLHLIRTQLGEYVVRAPFDGLVIEKMVELGETPARGICRIADDSKTLVTVDVNQEDINQVQPNQPAVVMLDAYPDLEYAARVYQIMPSANQAKNTVPVYVQVLKPDHQFRPQMSAKVFFVDKPVIENQKVRTVLVVDESAVFKVDGKSYVWRIRRGKVLREPIETGEKYGDSIEIISGVKADERVVSHVSKYQLQKGSRITPAQ